MNDLSPYCAFLTKFEHGSREQLPCSITAVPVLQEQRARLPHPERFAVKVSYLRIGAKSPVQGTLHPERVRNFSAITSVSEIFTPKTTVPTARETVPIGRHGDAIHTDLRNSRHR